MSLQSGGRAAAHRAIVGGAVLAGLSGWAATPANAVGLCHHKDRVVYVQAAPAATQRVVYVQADPAPTERIVYVREAATAASPQADNRGAAATPQAATRAAAQAADPGTPTVIRERYVIRDIVPVSTVTTVRVVQTVELVPVREKHCCRRLR